jgi:starch synthase
MGLGGLLRERAGDLYGILNGIDTSIWDPARDLQIAARFGADGLGNRAANKAALQRRLDLEPLPSAFLLGVINRLSWQKGLDLLLESLPTILGE